MNLLGKFPFNLKNDNVTPVFKKGFRGSKEKIDLLEFFQLFQRNTTS